MSAAMERAIQMLKIFQSRRSGAGSAFLAVFILLVFVGEALAQSCHVLRVNGARDWKPFSWRADGQDVLAGIFPDMTRSVLQGGGIALEYGPEMPWNRLLALLENDGIDLLAGALATEDRREKFLLSDPVAEEEVSIFVRANMAPKPGRLEDLTGLFGRAPFGINLGAEKNRFAAEKLMIDSEPVDNIAVDLKLLAEARIDYILMSHRFGVEAVNAAGFDNKIVHLPWPAAQKPVHFMFSKQSPCAALLPRFNAAIAEYRRPGVGN